MTIENGRTSAVKTAWNSIYLCTLFTFSTSFQFTMFMTSLWPFMKILDTSVAESFYGMVLALYSISQIIASPLLGYWSNRVQSHKMPLIFCNSMLLLSNILYMFFELFPTQRYRRYALCMSRFIAGVGWAQLGLLKSYVTAASLVADRSKAIAFITGGFAMGVIVGPALQTLFTLVDYPGLTICFAHSSHCINISMFTVPAMFASLINALLMVLLISQFRESHVAIAERSHINKSMVSRGRNVSPNKLPPYDRVALAACFALRFTQFFVFTIIETIGTAFGMLMFNWSPFEVVFYDSLAHAVRGVVALFVYIVYIVFDLGKQVNDRIVCLVSLLALFLFHLITYSWPFFSHQVQLVNSKNNSVGGGCAVDKYAWCAGLNRVDPWLYYGAIVLLIGPAFPNINVAMNTLFSRIIGPRIQSMQQGVLEMHGAIGRLVGPLLISLLYTSYGVRLIWMIEMIQITLMITVWLVCYSMLVPLRIDDQ